MTCTTVAPETETAPHILTVTTRSGQPHVEIACPYQPVSALMPCAVWKPCGCPLSDFDGGQIGLCRSSATGEHRYFAGEPGSPAAECFAEWWDDELPRAAAVLNVAPGIYTVQPYWDNGLRLRLVDTRAVA